VKFVVAGLGAAVVMAALTAATNTDAFAQLVRAALTKNVDEPWRMPWETRSQLLPAAGNGSCIGVSDCFNYSESTQSAIFDLRSVPAGKRWVVQSVSGGSTDNFGRSLQVELRSNRFGIVFDGLKWMFAGPFSQSTAFNSAVFSENLNVTFGPGETPVVRISATPTFGGYTVIVFNGYLIDATN
jgi:hypothetical protein